MKPFPLPPWLAASICALVLTLALPAAAAFTDNGNGTITDPTTGLIWDKCSIGQTWDSSSLPGTCTGTASTHKWAAALTLATTANSNSHRGFADWRLPNRTELESLVDIVKSSGATIDESVFPNTSTTAYYWSSTTYVISPVSAWYVDFRDGYTNASAKTETRHVRLVRSGQGFGAFDVLAATTPRC